MFTNINDLEGLSMYMFQCYFFEMEVINVYLNMTQLVGYQHAAVLFEDLLFGVVGFLLLSEVQKWRP